MQPPQPWPQAHMDAQTQAMAAAAAAAGGAVPPVPYGGGPATGPHGLYTHGYVDPAQAAAAASSPGGMGVIVPGAGVRGVAVAGGPGSVMAHQLQQQQPRGHQGHQAQQLVQQHPQAHAHHPQQQAMAAYMAQGQQQAQQVQAQQVQAQQSAGQSQQQQQQAMVGVVQSPQHQQHLAGQQAGQLLRQHMQTAGAAAAGMPMSGGYMTAQDYYGAQAAQQHAW